MDSPRRRTLQIVLAGAVVFAAASARADDDRWHPYSGSKSGRPFSNFGNDAGSNTVERIHEMANPQYDPAPPKIQQVTAPDQLPGSQKKASQTIDSAPPPATAASAHDHEADSAAADEPEEKPSPEEAEQEKLAGKAEAAANFETLVDNYVTKNSSDGRWFFVSGKAKPRELFFVGVDTKRMRTEAARRYVACATFRDAEKRRVLLDVTADFTPPDWKVVSVKPRSPKGPCGAED
jgi:hypothetical protein